ncbi:MAG: hypothetical protein KAV99_08215 [Candidatus Latescibacteria bacterium]|nr:hypothetical protein [Candidatus Latescibacterota bacterium]
MKFQRIELSKRGGQTLLSVVFEDGQEEKEWLPKWEDVFELVRMAALTEAFNWKGDWNKQMREFWETSKFIRDGCLFARMMVDAEGEK